MNKRVRKGMICDLRARINPTQQVEMEKVFDVIEECSTKRQQKEDVIQTADRLLLSSSPTVRKSKRRGINEREEEIETDQVVVLINQRSQRVDDAPIRNHLLEVCPAPCKLHSKRRLAGRLISACNGWIEESDKDQRQRQRCY